MSALILCYHSYRFGQPAYADDDFIALDSDLAAIRRSGLPIVTAREIAEALVGRRPWADVDRGIAITFDDGACLDFSPFMHGSHGELRPFRDSLERHDAAATSFVIASPDCRQRLEHEALSGEPMLGEDWWQPAVASSRFEIGNHSWDHNHGVMPGFAPGADGRGSFLPIANAQAAAWEIDQAQDYIARAVGSPPALFAYPYGDVPPFVATQYLPEAASRLGLLGAFTTEGCAVAPTTDPWRIPRVVCGDHWRSPEQFAALLNSLRDNG